MSERGLLLWPRVKKYVKAVGKGELPSPKVKSFEEMKICCGEVGIFNSIAREIKFLKMYQADQPTLPFLSEDMYKLIKGKETHFDETCR